MNSGMNPKERRSIHAGLCVEIVQKQDQRTGKRTQGVVQEILTNSSSHPHGIKVRLTGGQVGRVVGVLHNSDPGPPERNEP